jgi:hypothetical protein
VVAVVEVVVAVVVVLMVIFVVVFAVVAPGNLWQSPGYLERSICRSPRGSHRCTIYMGQPTSIRLPRRST